MVDFNASVEIKTTFNDDEIRQSMSNNNDVIRNHLDDVIKLKDQAVIDALISLGWTPPKGVRLSEQSANKINGDK
jgi:hypothetical protein